MLLHRKVVYLHLVVKEVLIECMSFLLRQQIDINRNLLRVECVISSYNSLEDTALLAAERAAIRLDGLFHEFALFSTGIINKNCLRYGLDMKFCKCTYIHILF